MRHPRVTKEWHDMIAEKALKNCSPEFHELAVECAICIATMMRQFDGSMLTLLMQQLEPNLKPNPQKSWDAQRNYHTSAANFYLQKVAKRGEKTLPARIGTHDKVCLYTSNIYMQADVPVSPRAAAALRTLRRMQVS